MIVRKAETPVSSAGTIQATPRMDGPTLKQPTFDWTGPDRYHELPNFKIEVKTCF